MDMNTSKLVNGIDLGALADVVSAVEADAAQAKAAFHVTTAWKGQTRSETTVQPITLGTEQIDRGFKIAIDEPAELLGTNTTANPQEVLMAALNACMMVGYVAQAALRGITLETVEIDTKGELDLRGFLGLSDEIKPGYDKLEYVVRIKGDGTPQDFAEIHEAVMKTSPNYFNLSAPVTLDATLDVME
jgi:uncharacterized OsmC-like protein